MIVAVTVTMLTTAYLGLIQLIFLDIGSKLMNYSLESWFIDYAYTATQSELFSYNSGTM